MENKSQPLSPQLQSHFLALYCMILADGVIDVKELETLYRIGKEQYGLTEKEINQAVLQNGNSFTVPENIDSKIKLLYNLATIAWADGVLEDTERNLMRKYISRLGFLDENIDAIAEFIFNSVKEGKTIDETLLSAKS